MYHPIISSANGKARHNEMIKAAENYRRVKKLQLGDRPQPSFLVRFIGSLSSLVSKSGSGKATDPMARTST